MHLIESTRCFIISFVIRDLNANDGKPFHPKMYNLLKTIIAIFAMIV